MDIRPPNHVIAWLGPLLIINLFVWVLAWTPQANAAICAGSDNCLTDWVGALSGWIAAGAAYVTIRTMNAQRAEANRYQREFVELEIMSRLALARRLLKVLAERPSEAIEEEQSWHTLDNMSFIDDQARWFENWQQSMISILNSQVLKDYDERVGIALDIDPFDIVFDCGYATANIEVYFEVLKNFVEQPEEYPFQRAVTLSLMSKAILTTERYFAALQLEVESFISKWQAKVS